MVLRIQTCSGRCHQIVPLDRRSVSLTQFGTIFNISVRRTLNRQSFLFNWQIKKGPKQLDTSHKSLVMYRSRLAAQFRSTKMAKISPHTTRATMRLQTFTSNPFTMKEQLQRNAKLEQIQNIRHCAAKVKNTTIRCLSTIETSPNCRISLRECSIMSERPNNLFFEILFSFVF